MQMSTDRGSETTEVFGLANALRYVQCLYYSYNVITLFQFVREVFAPNLSTSELPAHRFLKSIHNITIERGWLRLRLQWGDNVKIFWEAGAHIYIESNPDH